MTARPPNSSDDTGTRAPITFAQLRQAWAGRIPARECWRHFDTLPEDVQAGAWSALRAQTERKRL